MPVIRHRGIRGSALVFVTTTVREWLPVFSLDHAATELVCQLRDSSEAHKVSIMGYVVMPSHVHLLLGLSDYANLAQFMQGFKSLSSRRISVLDLGALSDQLITNGRFSLWMRRFDDLVVYSQRQFRRKLEYVHNNPVKAGLVSIASTWKYSSAGDWLGGKSGLIPIEKNFTWT